MVTLTFCLQLRDGGAITAQISSESPLEDAPVIYEGPLDRLPLAPQVASGIELRAYLRSFARELGARLSEKVETSIAVQPEGSETVP